MVLKQALEAPSLPLLHWGGGLDTSYLAVSAEVFSKQNVYTR